MHSVNFSSPNFWKLLYLIWYWGRFSRKSILKAHFLKQPTNQYIYIYKSLNPKCWKIVQLVFQGKGLCRRLQTELFPISRCLTIQKTLSIYGFQITSSYLGEVMPYMADVWPLKQCHIVKAWPHWDMRMWLDANSSSRFSKIVAIPHGKTNIGHQSIVVVPMIMLICKITTIIRRSGTPCNTVYTVRSIEVDLLHDVNTQVWMSFVSGYCLCEVL